MDAMLESSRLRSNDDLLHYLSSGQKQYLIHSSCRKSFTDKRQHKKLKLDEGGCSGQLKILRSNTDLFSWRTKCFFCTEVTGDCRNLTAVRSAGTLELRATILNHCTVRKDKWSQDVKGRLEACCDLVAEEAVYHTTCYVLFMRNKNLPSIDSSIGRPVDEIRVEAFDKLCHWLERTCDNELNSIDQLQDRMTEIMGGAEGYSNTHLQRKLQERYGDHIFFGKSEGRKNVVGFHDMCSFLINDKWYEDRKSDAVDESERVVHAAAKLIVSQIREMKADNANYPSADDITASETFVPSLLKSFMEILIPSSLKQNAISQCIIQAARLRTIIAPIPLALGVQVDHYIGSKTLIQELSRLGFSVSYDEVVRFKQSVLVSLDADDDHNDRNAVLYPSAFTQWVGDNVDHNVVTLDGHGTFHGMGIISITVPMTTDINLKQKAVRRILKRLPTSEVIANKGIAIVPYNRSASSGLQSVSLTALRQLQTPALLSHVMKLNLVWHSSWLFRDALRHPTNWGGYMQKVCTGEHSACATIEMLPIIDLNSSDETCIYSTLLFIEKQAKKLNIETPCITFDQPLWIKAVDIINATKLNIICRLGGFHTLMSFLGSVGCLMSGSGLEDIMELNYGTCTVSHILSGKAVSRAIRGHFLVHGALMMKLFQYLLPQSAFSSFEEESDTQDGVPEISVEPPVLSEDDVDELRLICDSTVKNRLSFTDCSILESSSIASLDIGLKTLKERLSSESRTAKLWLDYVNYIDVVKLFILAERTSDWHLHLHTVQSMLNLFAATGHNNYAKCGRLYIQLMVELPVTHPWLYNMFTDKRFHTIRRSDRFWAGLSTDLVIEQTMMKSIKGRSGLTRGRGMEENVRLQWVHSMHQCASIHLALASMTGVESSNPKHVDVGLARAERDRQDLMKIFRWLKSNDPFISHDGKLRSLLSGVTVGDNDDINCDSAEDIGAMINKKMDDKLFPNVSFKKKDQIRTLSLLQKHCTIGNKAVHINSATLFHRLILLVQRSEDIQSFFQYELAPVPTSLFCDTFMRKADKPALARVMKQGLLIHTMPTSMKFVIDGGALLHKLRWSRNTTFSSILNQYIRYIQTHYGTDAKVVFDGYTSTPSTKDHEHMRRRCKVMKVTPRVQFDETSVLLFDQQAFLANEINKKCFITLLMKHLTNHGYETTQASGDADTDIISAALKVANDEHLSVTVASDDTDILVMLVFHFTADMPNMYFFSNTNKKITDDHKYVCIRSIQEKLGMEATRKIIVTHALGGCDTTSSIYGLGKGSLLKKIMKCESVTSAIDTVQDTNATQIEVAEAGMQLMVMMYGGKQSDKLNEMRYTTYCHLAATSTSSPKPEKLPPTERAAFFHILRVHIQAVRWKTLNADELDPLDWGWKIENGKLIPIMTDQQAAPDSLLNVIRCKCKTGCTSNLCSCRKNGLMCVSHCTNCHGLGCSNAEVVSENDSDDDFAHDEDGDFDDSDANQQTTTE